MSETRDRVVSALAAYDPELDRAHLDLGEEERADLLARFPREAWPSMTLAEYAIGQENSTGTYCYRIEFAAAHLGSIRGGNASKLLIYKRKSGDGWHFDEAAFDSVDAAWERVRQDFVSALDAAAEHGWPRLADLDALRTGPALLVKTLHTYFPDRVLPIASSAHLRHFLGLLDREEASNQSLSAIELNLALLEELRRISPADGALRTNEFERFLYRFFSPVSAPAWLKISPGRQGMHWDAFLAANIMAVGWEAIGDLREFGSKAEFRAAYDEAYADPAHVRARKANALWRLTELRAGDKIVANRGKSKILAVGTVVEPLYEYQPQREFYRHVVHVEWDTSYARDIAPQNGWLNTIDKVTAAQRALIEASDVGPKPTVEVDPLYTWLASALNAKGQVVLYGPPGTGKTFHARRFAAWWLRGRAGDAKPEAVLADGDALAAAERQLAGSGLAESAWLIVANPKQWSWGDLFKDGKIDFGYRRLKRNYPKVQVGDLVFGYESSPTKRLVALARVSRAFGVAEGKDAPTIDLEPLHPIEDGPTYDDIVTDEVLSKSEAVFNGFQGTLFALSGAETQRLSTMVGQADASTIEYLEEGDEVGQLTFTTFHPSYGYEDFVEGFRPVPDASGELALQLEDGVFKRVCLAARADPGRPYLLVVDEINRANVAKVLGELITLLEVDKRGLQVTLPQSKERFVVPPNVYLLGTMNTADRSITLMDVALRRRFAFVELMPRPDQLEQAVGTLKLEDFLAGLNREVARVAGREKQIGHAYLMPNGNPVEEAADFARIFRLEILPLLQEYCYEEFGQLEQVLGPELVDVDAQGFKEEVLEDPDALVQALAGRFSASAAESDEPS